MEVRSVKLVCTLALEFVCPSGQIINKVHAFRAPLPMIPSNDSEVFKKWLTAGFLSAFLLIDGTHVCGPGIVRIEDI